MTSTLRSYFSNDRASSYYDDTLFNSYFSKEGDAFKDDSDDNHTHTDGVPPNQISFLQVFSSISQRLTNEVQLLVNSMGFFAWNRQETDDPDQRIHINIPQRLSAAKDFFDNKQYPEVIETLSECRRVAPKDHLLSFLLGASYYHLNDNISARDLLRTATRANDTDPLYHYYLGLTYRDLKEPLFATSYLEMAEAFSQSGSDINQACGKLLDEMRRESRFKPILVAKPRIHNYGTHILSCFACLSLGIFAYVQTSLLSFLIFSFLIILGITTFITYDKISNKYQFNKDFLMHRYGLVKHGQMPAKYSICTSPQLKKRTFVDFLLSNYWLNIEFIATQKIVNWRGKKVEIDELWVPSLGDSESMEILLDFFIAHGTWAKFIVESQTDRQK